MPGFQGIRRKSPPYRLASPMVKSTEPFALPFQIQQVTIAAIAHRPHLRFRHDGLALGIEQVMHRGPVTDSPSGDEDGTGDLAPKALRRDCENQSTAGLPASTPSKGRSDVCDDPDCIRQHTLAVGRHDRVDVGSKIWTSVLREDRLRDVFAIRRDRVRGIVLAQRERRGLNGRQLRRRAAPSGR